MKAFSLAVAALALSPTLAAADMFDMQVGSFIGTFCGYSARYDVDSQDSGTWIFHGRILIRDTGEYDPLWIEQYADNHLRIIRYLQGANLGLTQVVNTYPPQGLVLQDGPTALYETDRGGDGLGCARGSRTNLYVP